MDVVASAFSLGPEILIHAQKAGDSKRTRADFFSLTQELDEICSYRLARDAKII